eukprot:Sdes_comp18175_c0_seq1m7694
MKSKLFLHTLSRNFSMTSSNYRTCLVFPGQGSQWVGMGREISAQYSIAKETFEEMDHCLKMNLSTMMFSGPSTELCASKNQQPAILATSIAIYRLLEKYSSKFRESSPSFLYIGHSLGEFTASVALKCFSFPESMQLVRLRGEVMENCTQEYSTLMVALMPLSLQNAIELCRQVQESFSGRAYGKQEICDIANVNGGNQIVFSG